MVGRSLIGDNVEEVAGLEEPCVFHHTLALIVIRIILSACDQLQDRTILLAFAARQYLAARYLCNIIRLFK